MKKVLVLTVIMAILVFTALLLASRNLAATEPVDRYVEIAAVPMEGCPPLTVEFIGYAAGDVTNWLWRFGDGDSSIVQNPTHTYIDGGVFFVQLWITTPVGPDSSSKLAIHVEMNTCDTVRIDTLFVERPLPAQITIPVYAFADDSLGGFALGFTDNSERLIIDTVIINDDAFPPGESAFIYGSLFPNEQVLVGGLDFTPFTPWGNWTPAERIFDLVFDLDPDTPDTIITIDSTFVPPCGKWLFTATMGGIGSFRISPQYAKGVIVIGGSGSYICGDADGNQIVEVSDAVFLVRYIFVPGSRAPITYEAGDVDCNGVVDIVDAVYLINYIFVPGSPEPCDPDGDGEPDC